MCRNFNPLQCSSKSSTNSLCFSGALQWVPLVVYWCFIPICFCDTFYGGKVRQNIEELEDNMFVDNQDLLRWNGLLMILVISQQTQKK